MNQPIKNYLTLEKFSLMYGYYAFIDVPDYYADHLFIQHQVRVRFGNEYSHPDQPYVIIFCKVRKRDRERFLFALAAHLIVDTVSLHELHDRFPFPGSSPLFWTLAL